MAPNRIFTEEGGGRAGLKRTKQWMWRCLRLGGRCCNYNSGKKGLEYVFILEDSREEFEQAWEFVLTQEKERQTGDDSAAGGDDLNVNVNVAGKSKGNSCKGDKDHEKQKPNKTRVVVSDKDKAKKKLRADKFKEAQALATHLKSQYQRVLGEYTETLEAVMKEPLWKWAQTDYDVKCIKEKYAAVIHEKAKSPFYAVWLQKDADAFKAHWGKDAPDTLTTEITLRLGAGSKMPVVLQKLDTDLATLHAMHNARPEVIASVAAIQNATTKTPAAKRRRKD